MEYPGNLTRLVTVTCFVASMGGLIYGYDIGITGGVTSMPMFLRRFFPLVYRRVESGETPSNQYCKFESQALTLFTSSLYLAALVASLVASTVTRKFGRKLSMLIGGVFSFTGASVNAAAGDIATLIIGRILIGFGVGFANQSVPLYLSEMAPYKYRGGLNIGFQLSITIGILVANVLNYLFADIHNWGWRLSLGSAAIPAVIVTIVSLFLPETPNSLVERGHPEEAVVRLRHIRGVRDVSEEFGYLVSASNASKSVENPWTNLLQRKYRPHLTMAIVIPLFQQLTGINGIMFYAPVIARTIGFSNNAALVAAVISGSVNAAASLIGVYGADRWGRRFLFLEGGLQMLVSQVILAVCIGYGSTRDWPLRYVIAVGLFICIYVAAFAWSWGPLGWLVPSEIFPLEIRSVAQSVNVSFNMFSTFIGAQMFLTMLCHLEFGIFLFFSFFVLVMTVFVYFLVPETKGVLIEEMDIVWKKHPFWGRFIPNEQFPPSWSI